MSSLEAKDVERATVGMKLTCGFEMLLSDPQHKGKKAVREMQILLEDLEAGDDQLPTNAEMESWPQLDDDEGWMNIDYNDFEKELSGKGKSADVGEGFGDKSAQERGVQCGHRDPSRRRIVLTATRAHVSRNTCGGGRPVWPAVR